MIYQTYATWAGTAGVKFPLTRRALYRTLREDYNARDATTGNVDQLEIPPR